jgi:transcriptional regulator with XRE-family HTH domain
MIANERIRQVRQHRKMKSAELAAKANISAAEISLIEKQMRRPKTETLQRIAAALDVSTSFLLSEINADVPIGTALARESFQIFLRDAKPTADEVRRLRELTEEPSAPQTVQGWRDLVTNLMIYDKSHQ